MLYIKLGLAKNLIKAMKKDKPEFCHLKKILLGLSEAKLNKGVLNGPQIRAIFKHSNFKSTLNQKEKIALNAFEAVSTGFLGNAYGLDYKKIIKKLLIPYKAMGCNLSENSFSAFSFYFFSIKNWSCQR